MENDKQDKQNTNQILKIEEVVDFINKLGYKVDRSIIESTESDVITELYCSILEKLGVVKKDKLKIKFDGMENFSYTGLHDRPIYIAKLFNLTKKFVIEVIGIENFSSSDLFSPNPKRTRRILSGLIKFYKFKQGEKETHTTMKENLDNSILMYKENLTKFERTNNSYLKTKERKEKEKPQVDECLEKLSVLSSTKEDLTNKLEEMENKIKEKHLNLAENEEKIKNIDFLNETLNSKICTLKTQIVHSPEKLQNILEELKANIENLSTNLQENQSQLKNYERHQKILEALWKLFNEYENLILDLDKVMNNLSQVNTVIYEDSESKNKKEKNLIEVESKIDNLTKTLNNLGEYTVEFYNKQKSALASKEESLIIIKDKLQTHQKRLNEINDMIKVQLSNNKLFEDNITEIEKMKIEYCNQIEHQWNGLYNIVIQYSSNFSNILESR